MNRSELVAKCEQYHQATRVGGRITAIVGFAVLAGPWLIVRQVFSVPEWAEVIVAASSVALAFGIWVVAMVGLFRLRKKCDVLCPYCGAYLAGKSRDEVLLTGRCMKCNSSILDDDA
jgi:hypothetical protein